MLAWRAFKVEARGLCSLYRQYVYGRENAAICIPDAQDKYHEEGVPLVGCSCGFWATEQIQAILDRYISTPKDAPPEALGLCSAHGRFIEHEDGVYRFERITVIAVGATPHHTASAFRAQAINEEKEAERLHWLSEACRELGVPLHYDRSLEHVIGELAIEAGNYLK